LFSFQKQKQKQKEKKKKFNLTKLRCKVSIVCLSKRYATAPMPFRPGYGLGSIIQPEVIKGMKKEAQARSKISIIDQVASDISSSIKEIENEQLRTQNARKVQGITIDEKEKDTENKRYKARIERLQKKQDENENRRTYYLLQLMKVMEELIDNGMAPTTFDSGAMSPVDWTQTEIKYLERAYDSISVNASFHIKESQEQSDDEFAMGVASSTAGGGGGGVFFKRNVETIVSGSMQNAVSQSKEKHTANSVLVLSAFATHRKVQQFDKLVIDADRLVKAWNYNFPNDQIDVTEIKKNRYHQKFM